MGNRIKDHTGKPFGRLKALRLSKQTEKGHAVWLCECDCGAIKEVLAQRLVTGKTKSCGCLHKELKEKHGMSESSEYTSWVKMKQRCYNTRYLYYEDYGGRGIKVCDRWKDSFENFYEDMGDKLDKNYSIERLDVNKDYSPDNCVWADNYVQNRNKRRRKDNTTKYTGVNELVKDSKVIGYLARWSDLIGNKKSKYFSIKKYGEKEAFYLACDARENAIKQLNERGAGYPESHGK